MFHLHIPGLKCGGCLGAVTKAVQKLDPQAHVEGDLETRQVKIGTSQGEELLLKVLREAGYPAEFRTPE